MTTTAKVVSLTTTTGGVANVEVRLYGYVDAIALRIGTLSTPDVLITDGVTGVTVLTKTGVAADAIYQIRVPVLDTSGSAIANQYERPVVSGLLVIAISGAGSLKTGEIVIVHS